MALFQNSVLKKYLATQSLQSDITRLDREIDALVYDLYGLYGVYGLTEEEIRIVEESN